MCKEKRIDYVEMPVTAAAGALLVIYSEEE